MVIIVGDTDMERPNRNRLMHWGRDIKPQDKLHYIVSQYEAYIEYLMKIQKGKIKRLKSDQEKQIDEITGMTSLDRHIEKVKSQRLDLEETVSELQFDLTESKKALDTFEKKNKIYLQKVERGEAK